MAQVTNLASSLNKDEIIRGLRDGTLVRYGKKIFSKVFWDLIEDARVKIAEFDLLQLTKKIQL